MPEMVVVGNKRLTLPLTAVGFRPASAASAEELEAELDRLRVDTNVALVVLGESQAAGVAAAVARFRQSGHGAILIVPDGPQPQRLGARELRTVIEQAAGVDLLGKGSPK